MTLISFQDLPGLIKIVGVSNTRRETIGGAIAILDRITRFFEIHDQKRPLIPSILDSIRRGFERHLSATVPSSTFNNKI